MSALGFGDDHANLARTPPSDASECLHFAFEALRNAWAACGDADFAAAATVHAQLVDVTQTEPNVPGGAIGKSLQQQIGAGRGDEFTPGSSLDLIANCPA